MASKKRAICVSGGTLGTRWLTSEPGHKRLSKSTGTLRGSFRGSPLVDPPAEGCRRLSLVEMNVYLSLISSGMRRPLL